MVGKMNYNNTNKNKDQNNRFSIDLFSLIDTERGIIKSIEKDYLEDALVFVKERVNYIEGIINGREKAIGKTEVERTIQFGEIGFEDIQKISVIEHNLIKIQRNNINEKDHYQREIIQKKLIAITYYLYLYHKTLNDLNLSI